MGFSIHSMIHLFEVVMGGAFIYSKMDKSLYTFFIESNLIKDEFKRKIEPIIKQKKNLFNEKIKNDLSDYKLNDAQKSFFSDSKVAILENNNTVENLNITISSLNSLEESTIKNWEILINNSELNFQNKIEKKFKKNFTLLGFNAFFLILLSTFIHELNCNLYLIIFINFFFIVNIIYFFRYLINNKIKKEAINKIILRSKLNPFNIGIIGIYLLLVAFPILFCLMNHFCLKFNYCYIYIDYYLNITYIIITSYLILPWVVYFWLVFINTYSLRNHSKKLLKIYDNKLNELEITLKKK